jgi:uncharacterized protein related to proFAR isomerase
VVDFIFMLTRQDQTVVDCLETLDTVRSIGIRHVGFKDVGVSMDTLKALKRAIKDSGATSYMEVVSETSEDCIRSARNAVEIGVDRLLGGTDIASTLEILAGTDIQYMPFPGRPEGHPTRLGGSPDDVEQDCRRFAEFGCAGVDLLAYRATEADPLELVRAARRGMEGYLAVAGSIDSTERIRALAEAGADGFTIGTAALEGAFSPRKGSLASQIGDILEACVV